MILHGQLPSASRMMSSRGFLLCRKQHAKHGHLPWTSGIFPLSFSRPKGSESSGIEVEGLAPFSCRRNSAAFVLLPFQNHEHRDGASCPRALAS